MMIKFTPALLIWMFATVPSALAAQVEEPGSTVEWGSWYVLLPFDHPGGGLSTDKAHPPERELKAMRLNGEGPDFSRTWRGKKGRNIQWRLARSPEVKAPDTGALNFLTLVPDAYPDKSNALTAKSAAYAYRTFRSSINQKISASFGSDDGCRVWLNGKQIHNRAVLRGLNPRNDSFVLDLRAGLNHLLVKVCNEGGGWGCQLMGPAGPEEEAPETPQESINQAIDQGVLYLLKTQNLDGSWSHATGQYRNGQTALSVYAILKGGLTEQHPAVQRGLEYLRTYPPRKTYSACCQILALISTKSDRHNDWIYEIADELVDWQAGGFGYPTGQNDLSNTQYGALGLWAATTVGYEVPSRVWLYLLRNALNHQNKDGGFGYRSGSASTGAMTVAGLTIIGVCREGYGDSGFPTQIRKKAETSVEEGLEWLGDNFRSDKNPTNDSAGEGRWTHYYLYGLERLAAIMKFERIGNYDWYRQGSHFYVKSQGVDGQWVSSGGEPEPNTAFGVIFLKRGTQSLTGVSTMSRANRTYATNGANASIVLRASGDTPLNLWLSEIPPETVQKYSHVGPSGAGVYIDRAEYLADGQSIAMLKADKQRPWKLEKLPTQYKFATRGEHTVQLRLHLVPDPAKPGAPPTVIESPLLKVRIDKIFEDWMLDYPDDTLMNLGLGQRKTVAASSVLGGGHAAALAFDGNMGTAWVSAKADAQPVLTVKFKRAIRADRLLLCHPVSKELLRGQFDRATKIEVSFGAKREGIQFELDSNEEHKTLVKFPHTTKVSELRIRVVERETGSKFPGCVGFAEVELRKGSED